MSLPTQTLKRLPTIKANLLKGLNYQQIGEKCGVTEKTIDRDVGKWVDSGDFEKWIKEEFVRLHGIIIHENPTEAYRNVTKLISKMITRRAEVRTREEIDIRQAIIVKMWKPEEVESTG